MCLCLNTLERDGSISYCCLGSSFLTKTMQNLKACYTWSCCLNCDHMCVWWWYHLSWVGGMGQVALCRMGLRLPRLGVPCRFTFVLSWVETELLEDMWAILLYYINISMILRLPLKPCDILRFNFVKFSDKWRQSEHLKLGFELGPLSVPVLPKALVSCLYWLLFVTTHKCNILMCSVISVCVCLSCLDSECLGLRSSFWYVGTFTFMFTFGADS